VRNRLSRRSPLNAGDSRRRVDALQRRHPVLAFPYGVVVKYVEDQAGRLAATLTYYAFLSIFPLLLLVAATVSTALRSNPELRQDLLDELVAPALRGSVDDALSSMPTGGLPLAIGLVGLLLSGLGGVLAVYETLNQIWATPRRVRYRMVSRYLRVLTMLFVILAGAVVIAGLTVVSAAVLQLPVANLVAANLGALLVCTAVIVVGHRVLTAAPFRFADVWLGALLGAFSVVLVLGIGGVLLARLISRASLVYGSFATVAGAFTLLYLLSQALVICMEISAVRARRLWPRAVADDDPTGSDLTALTLRARIQERRPTERIDAHFELPAG